jgi:hypothetical protein
MDWADKEQTFLILKQMTDKMYANLNNSIVNQLFFRLIIVFSNTTTCPYGLRGLPSRLWPSVTDF